MSDSPEQSAGAYAKAGVNIDAKMSIIDRIKQAAASTYTPAVIAGIGSFGGIFQLVPGTLLVASTDGVGTKTMLAARYGRFRGLGHDIVNHSVNDILCQGARPLFFMDYIAANHLDPQNTLEVIEGITEACRAVGCALLGGETAEMPGVYQPDQFDLVGTIIGKVRPEDRLPAPDLHVTPGDVILGLPSSGPHTNGYSLIRRVYAYGVPPDLLDSVLAPHRCYLTEINQLRAQFPVKALAHITGGGFYDNIPRVLPAGLGVQINKGNWPKPPIFDAIAARGKVAESEMYRVFNMGIGMIAIVAPLIADTIATAMLDFPLYRIGTVVDKTGVSLI